MVIVEDAFVESDVFTKPLVFEFLGLEILPMAWSDNIMVFTNTVSDAAQSLRIIAECLERKHHSIKDDSLAIIVPASTRRLKWPSRDIANLSIPVVDQTRFLGYHITCNGDTRHSRGRMLGAVRGHLSSLGRNVCTAPSAAKARWWKSQYQGFMGFMRLSLVSTT